MGQGVNSNKPKRRYTKIGADTTGFKETDNLFMDGFNWREFNRRCDAFLRKCGIPDQPTATFLNQIEPMP